MTSSAIGSSSAQLMQAQLSSLQTRDQISTKVAAKAMDAQRAEGDAAIALLKSAAQTADQISDRASRPGAIDVMA